MHVARTMTMLLTACLASAGAYAQVNCSTSNKLACLVPFTTNAYVSTSSTANQATVFNGPIGVQLSQLPVAASAPGVVILTVRGNPETFNNLGPILLDRPDSVGQGKLVIGFSFQQFNFNNLDGIPIGNIPFAYANQQTGNTIAPTNYFQQTIHVSLKVNQYVVLGTYGLPQKTDISFVLPVARVSIGALNQNPYQYTVTSANTLSSTPISLASKNVVGSASGIGDIVVNAKHVLWSGGEAGRTSIATGVALRFPTGDAFNYLGSGAYGYNLYGLASYKARLSPHVRIAYQWNTNTALLNPSGTGPNRSLPGGAQYGVGADYGLTPALTLSADILASEFSNSPSIALTNNSFVIPASSVSPVLPTGLTSPPQCPTTTSIPAGTSCYLPSITTLNSTYTTASFSGGIKYKPFRRQNLILYGNVLIQMNNVGLRSDISPSGGLSYSFRPIQ